MFCLCGSSIRPLVPLPAAPRALQDVPSVVQDVSSEEMPAVSSEEMPAVSSEEIQDVSSDLQDVSSDLIQDVSSSVQDVSSAEQDVSPVQEECPIDLSGTDQIIAKIDEILHEIPVRHAEDPVDIAIAVAKLWLPPKDRITAVLGSPMSRATTRN